MNEEKEKKVEYSNLRRKIGKSVLKSVENELGTIEKAYHTMFWACGIPLVF